MKLIRLVLKLSKYYSRKLMRDSLIFFDPVSNSTLHWIEKNSTMTVQGQYNNSTKTTQLHLIYSTMQVQLSTIKVIKQYNKSIMTYNDITLCKHNDSTMKVPWK